MFSPQGERMVLALSFTEVIGHAHLFVLQYGKRLRVIFVCT